MNLSNVACLRFFIFLASAFLVFQPSTGFAQDFRVFWKDGLRMETVDESVKLKVGGRVDVDAAWANANQTYKAKAGTTDTAELRRARLGFEGELYERVEFAFDVDFAGDPAVDTDTTAGTDDTFGRTIEIKDAYLDFHVLPGDMSIQVGHYKEPFSLEELTSNKYITFMERGLPNAFSPERNLGVMVHGDSLMEGKATFALGIFRDVDDNLSLEDPNGDGMVSDRAYALTTRLTFAPLLEDKGEKLVHLGVSYTYRNTPDNEVKYDSRPEAHLFDKMVSTDDISDARSESRLSAEGAANFGPVSVQGEYMFAYVDSNSTGDPLFNGFYVQASYFLTGEFRPYKEGKYARVHPTKNAFDDGGFGAWEVALRFSRLDLTDDGVTAGGEEKNLTAAINWYIHSNVRVMVNYVVADAERAGSDSFPGTLHVAQTRLHFDI
ncbi:MAG: porin [Bdellovibrionota bacterium]